MLLLALGWLAVATIASSPPIWSQLGHDAQHTGRSAVQGPLTQPSQRWQVLFNDLAPQYFAVDRDGVVIVARDDTVTALNPATGGVNWQYSLGADDDGFGVQFSSTAIGSDGTVYIGTIGDTTPSGGVAGAGILIAVDPPGTHRWSVTLKKNSDLGPVVIAGATVYVVDSTESTPGSLHAVEAASGTTLWTFTPEAFCGTPVVAPSGTVYVGCGHFVWALDPTGGVVWKASFGTPGLETTLGVGHNGMVYVGQDPMGALDGLTGELKWSFSPPPPCDMGVAPAIAADGTVYFACSRSSDLPIVYALDGDNGQLKWRVAVGKVAGFLTPVIGADGTLYVLSLSDGVVYALDPASGATMWHVPPASNAWDFTDLCICGAKTLCLLYSVDESDAVQSLFGYPPSTSSSPSPSPSASSSTTPSPHTRSPSPSPSLSPSASSSTTPSPHTRSPSPSASPSVQVGGGSPHTAAIVSGAVVGGVVVVAAAAVGWWRFRRRQQHTHPPLDLAKPLVSPVMPASTVLSPKPPPAPSAPPKPPLDWCLKDPLHIGEELARGSFGLVCRATLNGVPVAAKSLHALLNPTLYRVTPGDVNHQAVLAQLQQEAQMLQRLNHPNIVRFIGVSLDDTNTPRWIVTELATCSLGAFLRRYSPLPRHDVVRMFKDILRGLQYLHARGMLHRDLKPENVLMFGEGGGAQAKLADVGISRLQSSATMSVAGTMYYMAGEVLGGRYGPPVDVFSCGVMLAEVCLYHAALTGATLPPPVPTCPLPRDDLLPQAVSRLRGPWREAADLIVALTEQDPAARPTASQALARFEAL